MTKQQLAAEVFRVSHRTATFKLRSGEISNEYLDKDQFELRPDRPLRNQVDLDSMDWLNFLIGLHEKLKVEISEGDYARLVTLGDVLDYLKVKLK